MSITRDFAFKSGLESNGTVTLKFGGTQLGSIFNDSSAVNFQVNSTATGGLKLGTTSTYPIIGYTNNLERFRVDSSGNFGVGVSPSAKLHVKSANETLRLETTATRGNGNNYLMFFDPTGQKGYLGYGNGSGDALILSNSLNADILFLLNGENEKMRITAGGNLLVGTSTSGARLKVSSSSTGEYATEIAHTGVGHGLYVNIGASATGNVARFDKNGSPALVVDNSGRVSIGATSGASPLTVTGAASIDTSGNTDRWVTRIRDSNAAATGVGGGILFQGIKSAAGAAGNFGGIAGIKENGTDADERGSVVIYTTPVSGVMAERFRVDSSGNVGIGVTPSTRLHVKSTDEVIRVESTTARGGGRNYINFRDPTGDKGYLGFASTVDDIHVYNNLAGNIILVTSANERMRISSAGKVTIGATDTSESQLRVDSSATSVPVQLLNGRYIYTWSGTKPASTAVTITFTTGSYFNGKLVFNYCHTNSGNGNSAFAEGYFTYNSSSGAWIETVSNNLAATNAGTITFVVNDVNKTLTITMPAGNASGGIYSFSLEGYQALNSVVVA